MGEDEPPRGELPQRLTELLIAQAEVARAAGMWTLGEVHAPLAQLEELSRLLKALAASCDAAVGEARIVYRETRQQYARIGEPTVVLGRWRNDA